MEVDWLELPEHLTSHVMGKLSCITDYARFGDVCVKWRAIFRQDYGKIPIPRQPPLLMTPTPPSLLSQENKNKNKNQNKNKNKNKMKNGNTALSCSFYRVTDGKIFKRLQLTMPRDRYVRGSSHGWLITVDADEICYSVQLMNPFFYPNTSTKEIKLPPLIAHPSEHNDPDSVIYFHLAKAVLSADPVTNPKDVIVMAIFGEFRRLSFCKPRDEAWTPIQDHVRGLFHDVVYYQGKFYAVDQYGTVVVCNVEEHTTTTYARPPVNNLSNDKKYLRYTKQKYLVVSVGKLFQVYRYVADSTMGFKVFSLLQKRESDTDWAEVKDLSGHAFFIGDNASMSISASDFPGCTPNCIYYTDDYIEGYWRGEPSEGPHDLGLFNLENGTFEKHYPTDTGIHLWPASVWIEPTLPRTITRSKRNVILNHCC